MGLAEQCDRRYNGRVWFFHSESECVLGSDDGCRQKPPVRVRPGVVFCVLSCVTLVQQSRQEKAPASGGGA